MFIDELEHTLRSPLYRGVINCHCRTIASHDHWPQNSWKNIDSGVAKLLIRGQFLESKSLTHGDDQRNKKTITRIYSLTAATREKAKVTIPELAPATKPTRSATGLSIQASAAQHLLITSWLLTDQAVVEEGVILMGIRLR